MNTFKSVFTALRASFVLAALLTLSTSSFAVENEGKGQLPCDNPVTISFSELSEGEVVTSQYASLGLTISATGPSYIDVDKAIIFDSSCPNSGICSGGDQDLGTPNIQFGGPGVSEDTLNGFESSNFLSLGKILIVAENDFDFDNNGFVDDPDDAIGGALNFNFAAPVRLVSMRIVDIESGENIGDADATVFTGKLGVTTQLQELAQDLGDNAVENHFFNSAVEVDSLTIDFATSGAVDDFVFCPTEKNMPPVCGAVETSGPAQLGQPFTAQITGIDPEGENLTVFYNNAPNGATVTPPSGTTTASPAAVNFSYTPTIADAGQTIQFSVMYIDNKEESVTCPLSFTVPENEGPSCDAGQSESYMNLQCTGASTTVTVNGSGSSDSDNFPQSLSYSWSTNCPNAQIASPNSAMTDITFDSETAEMTAVSCQATLTVSDGDKEVSCPAVITVQPCPRDCLGNINGEATFDICGVCEGDGTSCLDCLNQPNGSAEFDRCGVCEGNGESCLGCETNDITATQVVFDGTSATQQKLIDRIAKRILRTGKSRRFANNAIAQAEALQIDSWTRIWQIPSGILSCSNTEFCVSVSSNADTASILENTDALDTLLTRVVRRLRRITGKRRIGSKFLKLGNEAVAEAELSASQIPTTVSSCS